MVSYRDAYLSSIPQGQRDAILKILRQDQATGLIGTQEQFEHEFKKLVKSLASGRDFRLGLEMKKPLLDEPTRISSEMLNDNFKSIFVALHGLFNQITKADTTAVRHRAVRKSQFSQIRAATNKLLEDLAIYQFLKLKNGWTEAKYSNFWHKRNGNTTIKAAEVDERTKSLRLRIGANRRLQQLTGSAPTKVTIASLGGGRSEGLSKSFQPENMLDNNPDTFWAHLLMADGPVKSVVNGSTVEGAAVQVEVEFPNAEPVSTLQVLPFGAHPVDLSNLQYWDGDRWQDAVGVSYLAASLEWQEFGFVQVQTNKVRFVLRQRNFTKNTYLVPRRIFANALLWEMALDEELLLDVREADLTQTQRTAIEANPRFRALVSGMKRMNDRLQESGLTLGVDETQELMQTLDAVTRVMVSPRETDAEVLLKVVQGSTSAQEPDQDDMVEITKVEYLMGLYQVAVEHRDHYPIGIFESPEYDNKGTVYEVGLDVDEYHVEDASGKQLTSIEYELEVAPKRRMNILPFGATSVLQELLKIEPNTFKGRLRFTPQAGTLTLYKDGVVNTSWSLSGVEVTITSRFNRNHVYTADYTSAAAQDTFDIDASYNSVPLARPETFSKTDDNGLLTLSFYPYVAWEVINNSNDWVKPDRSQARYLYRLAAGDVTIDGRTFGPSGAKEYAPIRVLVDGILARNITDYRGGFHPAFAEAPGQSLVYEYIHVGRKLYFNRPVEGATIEVSYRWLTQYVKLIATLRGHQAVVNPYTPELKNYRLRMKTSRL